jgi:enamine deaminase RidA (YjgF/YER057c/UK114 family)
VERRTVAIANPYAERIGFSRAVRVGPVVAVGGTAPIGDDGETVGVGDPAAQARRCFEIIGKGLAGAGASFDDVVRTRTFLTRIADYEAVAAVRKEFVGHVKPVDTIVQVDGFVRAEWLVEVEVDAVIADATAWTPDAAR